MTQRQRLARDICVIGARLYQRGFAAANDGNLSCRLSDQRVLCTPSLICKGFMQPRDLCVVDLDGRQVSGERPRTSEILLHVALYRSRPDLQAVVHCHPPHATAFAITRRAVPGGILPEAEIFLGDVPIVAYETPGTAALARLMRPHAKRSCVAILKNHGTVAWADSPERAFWWTEILDAYCRVLLLAKPLGKPDVLPRAKRAALRRLRSSFVYPKKRHTAANGRGG